MAVEQGLDAKRIQELDQQYVLHSWSVQNQISPLVVTGGEGRYFWDADGNRYLDFASQLVNVSIGHQHPKVVAAIKEQADKLTTIGPPMAHEARPERARLLAEVTPGDLTMSFFRNGGAEANENAIKLARWYTGRDKIVARYRSSHGATAGAITLTGDPRRWPAEPGIPGVVRMLDPYTYRCPAGHPDPCPVCTGGPHLEEILQYKGPQNVAAVILETIVGTNGIIVPPDGYLQSVREVCDRHGILLICDEVMAGFGRSGKWFACEHWDVVPDILTLAKGINSGYVPLGAMVIGEKIADWVRDKYFAGGLTYSGHVLACASAIASIEAFQEEGVVENSAAMSWRRGSASSTRCWRGSTRRVGGGARPLTPAEGEAGVGGEPLAAGGPRLSSLTGRSSSAERLRPPSNRRAEPTPNSEINRLGIRTQANSLERGIKGERANVPKSRAVRV